MAKKPTPEAAPETPPVPAEITLPREEWETMLAAAVFAAEVIESTAGGPTLSASAVRERAIYYGLSSPVLSDRLLAVMPAQPDDAGSVDAAAE